MVAKDKGRRSGRRSFGYIRRLPSRRYQASYIGPDLARHAAPDTFEARLEAEAWLAEERRMIASGSWIAPKRRSAAALAALPPMLSEYSASWLDSRTLRPRTRAHYRQLLDRHILPELGEYRLSAITPMMVRNWHAALDPTTPTYRAHAYSLLRTIMGTALSEQLITINPCVIRGGGSSKTAHKSNPATLEELAIIAEHMPDRLRLAVLIAAWCGLRFGEIFELRRRDLDLDKRVIRVRRAVARVAGEKPIVGPPTSTAGVRDVSIPPHLLPEFQRHLADHTGMGARSLLFPGTRGSDRQMAPATLFRWFYRARQAAGRSDLRFHDLRHTGATLAAATGATLSELMARLGHTTVRAAMTYQLAAADRDRVIAEALSAIAQPISLPTQRAEER
jgi:integrase